MTTNRTRRDVLALAGATFALAGCVGSEDGSDGNGDDGSDGNGNGDGDSTSGGWRSATLEDVTTGESFTISDIDKPVVLHTFATWCSTCKSQQGNLKSLHAERGDDVVFVDMTIDENDDPEKVESHAEENGFGWRFVVSPGAVTRSLVEEFGQSIAVAPQSPVVVVCPDGSANTVGKIVSAAAIGTAIDENCA
jgi:thiol-disulfide isomerase/thioredoxin